MRTRDRNDRSAAGASGGSAGSTPPWKDPQPIFATAPAERLQPFFERMSEPRPFRARTKAEWLERRGAVRARTYAALGLQPMPDRAPLELHVGGILERDGYRVERLYWQSWPGSWASGWLYLPEGLTERAPAILNPHGHWEGGARHPTVQSRLISLAKLGYVTLAVDSVHVYDYATGLTPLSAMTVNNLRALDLLCAREDVDRERLGVTGASGGAQQAMYLLAVDDRVRVGVLAAMVTHFRRILTPEGHHCPCNHIPGLMRFTDAAELCAIPSPRAVLYLTLTGDWTAPFSEVELGELRAAYRLWGQEDRLAHARFEGPHDYSRAMREAAYTWFARELRGDRSGVAVSEPEHTVEDPATLAALDSPPPGDTGPEGIVAWFRKRTVAQPPQLESKASRRAWQERVRAELVEVLGGEPEPVALDTVWCEDGPGLSFRTERDVRIPAYWLPAPGDGPRPALLALHPEGKAEALRTPLVRQLHAAGWSVLAPDLRFRGELQRDWFQNTVLWGRPEAGMAAWDARACIEWLYERPEVDPKSLAVLGEGDQGVVALLAAALDERVTATVADCSETTYRDGGAGLPVIPNILRVADVPQLAALLAPRPLWLYRVPGERVGFSSRRYYDWTRRTFQSLGELEALEMSTGEAPEGSTLAEWLRQRVRRAHR